MTNIPYANEINQNQVPVSRTPAAQKARSQAVLRPSFTPERRISLGKSYVLTKDVGAIPRAQFSPKFGQLISQDALWSFYRKSPEEASIPVAYNHSSNKFHPISRVLQVKGATQEMREALAEQGLQEYHYIQNLKLLFIESSEEEVLKTYDHLKSKGLKVDLEVITDRHVAN